MKMPRWGLAALAAVIIAVLAYPLLFPQESGQELTFSEFRAEVEAGNVESLEYNNNNGDISGELTGDRGVHHHRPGPSLRRRP